MKKRIIGFVVVAFVLTCLGGFYAFFFMGTSENVNANSDYICIKDVSRSCDVNPEEDCGEWQSDGTRICTGTTVTKVAYYHLRTSCEAGYDTRKKRGNRSGSSGRHSSDFVYATDTCSVQQVDNVSPTGEESVDM